MNPTDNLICIIMDKRIIAIKERLESEINSISLDIEDQGYMHKGHTAHTEGKMHIWVEIVSDDFVDMNAGGTDADDNDPTVYLGAIEILADGID